MPSKNMAGSSNGSPCAARVFSTERSIRAKLEVSLHNPKKLKQLSSFDRFLCHAFYISDFFLKCEHGVRKRNAQKAQKIVGSYLSFFSHFISCPFPYFDEMDLSYSLALILYVVCSLSAHYFDKRFPFNQAFAPMWLPFWPRIFLAWMLNWNSAIQFSCDSALLERGRSRKNQEIIVS